jgi:hypothetical protein
MPSDPSPDATSNSSPVPLRQGATVVEVFNSGLEVWLYDEQNTTRLREGIGDVCSCDDAKLKTFFRTGDLVAYSLYQDDGLRIAVIVGAPLTAEELSISCWLEPQTAFLRLPSGRLCIDSNDSLRFGEEEPGDEGATVIVPPGDYRLTLYRIDHEALDRQERTWEGAQEVVLLTPGGTAQDAATDFLPFEEKRDLSWSGAYRIEGKRFEGLIWFPDYWDTFIVNIDSAAAGRLGLVAGQLLRVTAPDTGHSIVTVFAPSWEAGRKLAPPPGPLDEYAFGSITPMQQWKGAEGFFCRRDVTKTSLKEAHKNVWLPAVVEVLDLPIAQPPARIRGELIHDAGKRVFFIGTLVERTYFDQDLQFLTAQLMSRVPDVPWGEGMPLRTAVGKVDAELAGIGLRPLGDFSFDVQTMRGAQEFTNRLYGGLSDIFAAIWGSTGTFTVFFFSTLVDGRWALTGAVRQQLAKMITQQRPKLSVRGVDGRLGAMVEAHRTHLAELGTPVATIPTSLPELVRLYEDYLVKAVD